jgi:uncharacterized glyoxalase superfamily protein PhnB
MRGGSALTFHRIRCLFGLIPLVGRRDRPASALVIAMSTSTMQSRSAPPLSRLTPVLVVEEVEPCVAFWIERFALVPESEVPGADGKLVFAIVKRGDVEIMYQTRASVVAERPSEAPDLVGHSTALFITTEDLDAVERALEGVPVVQARHKTFYGSEELYVREPGGNTVGFAQFT